MLVSGAGQARAHRSTVARARRPDDRRLMSETAARRRRPARERRQALRRLVAVDGISLEIPRGSFFALLGPSGCGKTTTLRMIGGFEEPTEGRIFLGDQDVVGLPPYKRDVNTVFQSYALFPHMTIDDNVAFGLERRACRRTSVRGRVARDPRARRARAASRSAKPKQLSGGQQQRVALARALVNHPRVLLLDEPLGALDLKLRKQMQLELKRIQHEVGITFVHVTHDQEEAMTMADTIAVMNQRPDRAARPAAGAVRAAGDGVRRRLPRRLEPPARDGRGPDAIRLDDGTLVRAGVNGRPGRSPPACGPRRSRSVRAGGANELAGTVAETAYIGVATAGRRAHRCGHRPGVRAEHRRGRARPAAGTNVVLSWAPGVDVRRRRDDSANEEENE